MNELFELIETSIPTKDNTPATLSADSSDAFGCCSHYRGCSDARACQIPEREYSKNCIYRKKIDAGISYYGKCPDDFSLPVYAEFLRRVDALSPEARKVFDSILLYMRKYYRATFTCVVYDNFIEELSSVGLFTFRPLTPAEFPPRKPDKKTPRGWKYDTFSEQIRKHPRYGPLFERACAEQEAKRASLLKELENARDIKDCQTERKLENTLKSSLPGANTKEFLLHWLSRKENAGMLYLLSAPYRMAVLSYENLSYAEELYRDTLLPLHDNIVYPRSVWWENEMLSPAEMKAEEERRIKLSPGYSAEQKAALLESLDAEIAARAEAKPPEECDERSFPGYPRESITVSSEIAGVVFGRCLFSQEWPDWELSIHADDAQIERQGRAMKYPFTFKISKRNKTATFSSTSDLPYYTTTLSHCTCHDFQNRGLPCKHMYRLAVELGIIEIINRKEWR